MVSEKAVEVAARQILESSPLRNNWGWEDVSEEFRAQLRRNARVAIEAALPVMLAEAPMVSEKAMAELRGLVANMRAVEVSDEPPSEFDKGYEQARQECADELDAALDKLMAEQPEAQAGGADFHDILYGAKVKLYLNPENDESSVPLVVGATFGPTDNLEIMLHAEQDGEVVKLYTTPPAKVPDGYVLVPVEPTAEMLESAGTVRGYGDCHGEATSADSDHLEWWAAMLAAAQQPKEGA